MIMRRTHALSAIGRELFEALSVAVEPLSRAMLCRAVKAPDAELSRQVSLLIHKNLIRITGGSEAGRLEPFHDQVREALLASLSPADLRNWHRRLAETFETDVTTDPQKLLQHYLGAGDTPAVFRSANAAAKIAEKALAFDRAAGFYLTAINTGHGDKKSSAMLHRQRAETLAKAGRGKESAAEYLTAALEPEHNDVFQMRRLAAEQLMRSGYMDQGVEAFKGLLRSVGFWMPATPLQSILAMLAIRGILRLRGLQWLPRHEVDVSSAKIRKLDLLWSGASVFFIVNPVFGTYLQARHMLGALRAGEPLRLALSLGQGALYESLGGVPYYPAGNKLLALAESIASNLQNSYLSSALAVDRLLLDFLCGRIERGLEQSRRAVQLQRELGFEQTFEGSTAKLGVIWFLGWGGKIREMSNTAPGILEEARSRGDVYTFVLIRCMCLTHLADLAADDPDRAIEEMHQALGQWSQVRYDSPRLGAAVAVVECELYAGRIEEARKRMLAEWPAMMRSLLSRKCQWFRIMLFYMRARTSLALWILQKNDSVLLKETESYISRLRKMRSPMGTALGDALQSSVESGMGHHVEAIILLDNAETILRQQGSLLLAAAISRRRGELEGENGSNTIQAADAFMKMENIIRPDRMIFMILPG
jgi:tetratricopeptide (TPR) repeat protein